MRHVNDRKHAERMQILYQTYYTVMVRHVYSRICDIGDFSSAEDICQEAFLRLDKNLHKVPDEKVKAWLFSVTDRLTQDYLREKDREEISIDTVMEAKENYHNEHLEPEWIMEYSEKRGLYKNALAYLRKEKPHWFRVICMSYLEGMSNREIAKELGISANLVSQWKRRASVWLREVYEREK